MCRSGWNWRRKAGIGPKTYRKSPRVTAPGAFLQQTSVLADLTRVKSTRACRPWQARYRARPGRRGRIYRRRRKRMAPCPSACAFGQSAPANVHRTFAFGSSGSAKNQGPSPRLTAGGPCVFRPCPRSGPTAKMRSACPAARPYPGSSCWIWPAPNRVSPFRPGAGASSPARPGAAGFTGVRSPRAPRLRVLRPGGPHPLALRLGTFGQSDPATLHRRVACRVLWQRQSLSPG